MRQVAEGVWQLSGWPRNMFNVYLMEDVIVDAATRWAKGRLLRQLRGRQVRMLALTHCHPDHQGSADFLCREFGIPLACHEADVDAVEGRRGMEPQRPIIELGVLAWAGPPRPVQHVLRDGDPVGGFRVVHAPGHTPGHILFFRDSDRVAIAGDLLANMNFLTGKPGLREPPPGFCWQPATNRRSLRILLDLNPSLVCFGHGPPLADPTRLRQFLVHRLARLHA